MRKQLCCHEAWSHDTRLERCRPLQPLSLEKGPCMSRLTNWTRCRFTGEQNGWHLMPTWATWIGVFCRWIGLMMFVFCWNLEPLEVGRREVWRSVNDRRTVWVSLGRPTDGEGVDGEGVLHILVLHILVYIYIYGKRELCFARKSDHSFCHLPLADATNGVDSSSRRCGLRGTAWAKSKVQEVEKVSWCNAMDIYLNSNCHDQQRRESERERERSYKHIKTYHI